MPASYINRQPSYARRHPIRQRSQTTLFLAHRAMEPAHLLHPAITDSLGGNTRQLKSKNRFVPAAQLTVHQATTTYVRRTGRITNGIRSCMDNTTRPRTFIPDIGTHPPGMALPRTAWVRLNRLRTGVGRFGSCLYNWAMASSAACEFGAEERTIDHVVLQCPIRRSPHGLHGLTVLDDEAIEWPLNTCPEI